MTASVDALLQEHAELERALADPAVHADVAHARKLGRRYAEIGPVVAAARELAAARYAWPEIARRLSGIYELVTGGARAPAALPR